jgi:hypothetical protein
MEFRRLARTLVIVCGLSAPGIAVASGSGHGGGHSGGGGHSSGGAVSRGPVAPSRPAAPATTATSRPTTSQTGGTGLGTAVPRGNVPGPFAPIGSPLGSAIGSSGLPYRVLPYYGTAFGFAGLGLFGGYYDPLGFGYGYGYPPGAFSYGYGGYGYGAGYGYGGYGYGAGGYGGPDGYGYSNSFADSLSASSPDSGFSAERSDSGFGGERSDSTPTVERPDPAVGVEGHSRDFRGPDGGLRLKIEPRNAQVFVDGYYAGLVDDFDGHFQQLKLAPGPHHVEVRTPGHEPLKFDVNIRPRQTTVYEGTLVP